MCLELQECSFHSEESEMLTICALSVIAILFMLQHPSLSLEFTLSRGI